MFKAFVHFYNHFNNRAISACRIACNWSANLFLYQLQMVLNILLCVLLITLVPDSFGTQILFYKEPLKVKSGVCCFEQTAKPDTIQCFSVDIKGKQNLVLITTDSLNIQTTETIPNKSNANNSIEIYG